MKFEVDIEVQASLQAYTWTLNPPFQNQSRTSLKAYIDLEFHISKLQELPSLEAYIDFKFHVS